VCRVSAANEGLYYVDERLNRSDIRSDPATGEMKPGVPLQLAFNVVPISGVACAPLVGAHVDMWQCDVGGVFRRAGSQRQHDGVEVPAGYQVTDAAGTVRFTTISPGHYPGRAVHIHFKLLTDEAAARAARSSHRGSTSTM
jgi:protocatechuate 3,4-dioxygenase beta subunit